jgi:hypothetical protein
MWFFGYEIRGLKLEGVLPLRGIENGKWIRENDAACLTVRAPVDRPVLE